MAGLKLDGAGQAKLKTLDDAQIMLQRVHNIVEQYALAVKRGQTTGSLMMNLKRQFPALAGLLKGQFGMIADQILALNLMISRGANEAMRVRQMREGVASIRQAVDIMIHHVQEKHAVPEEEPEPKVPVRRVTVKQPVVDDRLAREARLKAEAEAEEEGSELDEDEKEEAARMEGKEKTDAAPPK
jgi:hypothetical protein